VRTARSAPESSTALVALEPGEIKELRNGDAAAQDVAARRRAFAREP